MYKNSKLAQVFGLLVLIAYSTAFGMEEDSARLERDFLGKVEKLSKGDWEEGKYSNITENDLKDANLWNKELKKRFNESSYREMMEKTIDVICQDAYEDKCVLYRDSIKVSEMLSPSKEPKEPRSLSDLLFNKFIEKSYICENSLRKNCLMGDKRAKFVRFLLKEGDYTDKEKDSLLLDCSNRENSAEVVGKLVLGGADFKGKDSEGNIPLMRAIQRQDWFMVLILFFRCPCQNRDSVKIITNNKGETAYNILIRTVGPGPEPQDKNFDLVKGELESGPSLRGVDEGFVERMGSNYKKDGD